MDHRKLPTNYDVAVHIFSHATQPESKKMKEVLNQYSKTLADAWHKSFGSDHTMSLTAIKYRLKKVVKDYYQHVYIKAHQKKRKHNEDENCLCDSCLGPSRESQRMLERSWKKKNDVLFDIVLNIETLEGREKSFYEDQKNKREGFLSTEIDQEYK